MEHFIRDRIKQNRSQHEKIRVFSEKGKIRR
jgi:hypothetical protein